ncbi:MAG: hypothetical protein DME16_01725 [Candidatus Rokuibacteriota bacterium]|nr:MAG: hypothetical protein DME16_01725 [Candidatus Rokubacteria bacterium]
MAKRRRTLRSRFTVTFVVGALVCLVAAGALAQVASKSSLIGKLEGPEVVTDPAKLPKQLKEAPQLAALVKAGKLPPVAERVGQDPLVIKPLKEIGKYGGALRAGFTGPADFWNGFRCCSGPDHLMFWDYTGDKAVPNLAKGLEMQDGGKAWLVHLRRGMKWSDGKPFTADDFVFWFEDIYRNKDLVPTPTAVMAINGKQGVIEKVDTLTVRFKFPEPYFMFPDVLAGSTDLAGQWGAYRGIALAVEDGDADKHADVDARAQPVQRVRRYGGQPASLHGQGRADARREPRSTEPARDRRRVRLRVEARRPRQVARLHREPAEGQLQGLPGPRRLL